MTDRDQLIEWDRQYVWHPFTPHSAYGDEKPLMVVGAEGHELIDADGRRLLDGVGSLWCNIFGHRHPTLDAALAEQAGRVAHATLLGNSCDTPVRLAKRLIEIAPEGLGKVFYSDSGSTAVEIALKMALQYWQQSGAPERVRYLTMRGAYHGDTIGSVSVGGIDLFHERYRPLLFEVIHGTPAYTDQVVALIHQHGPELAAVVVEPGMQGAAGMLRVPDGFLRAVRDATRDVGTLLIVDEVAMGMGRSGKRFACEVEGVSPDLLCLAKGLTGGYLPLAATLATDEIYAAFLGPPEEGRTFFHGHTFTGNALGAAVALAALDLLDEVLPTLPGKIAHLASELERLKAHECVGEIRQFGLAAGVELTGFDPTERRGMKVCGAANDAGVFLRPLGDVIVLMPALTMSRDELTRLVDAIDGSIAQAC